VRSALETVTDIQENPFCASRGAVREHLADLNDGACGNCTSSTERLILAQLLMEYSDVFCRGDGDMGMTKVISHQLASPLLGSQPDV